MPVHLTATQRQLLIDITDMYEEGIADAERDTLQDNSLGDLETLLKVCGGYAETVRELRTIRKQLSKEPS